MRSTFSPMTTIASTPAAIPNDQPLKLLQLVDDVADPADRRRATSRQAEDRRDLFDEYFDADTGEHARHDREREEIGDPAEPEQAGSHQERSDEQRCRAHQMGVGCRARGGQRCDPRSKDGGDCRVAPTDIRGCRPKRAKNKEPATKA